MPVQDPIAISRIRSTCERLGYSDDLRAEEFPVWSGRHVTRADLVCFFEPIHDLSTATLVCGVVNNDRDRERYFAIAEALATPASLLMFEGAYELWAVGASEDARPSRLDLDIDDPAVARFLAPLELRRVKERSAQMPLFDIEVDLLARARSQLTERLDARVRRAMRELVPPGPELSRADAERAAELVTQALALLATRDKLTAGRDYGSAWAILEDRFPSEVLIEKGRFHEAERIADLIGEGVNFASLDAGVLGDVYENAILEPSRRSALGAFYTPPDLGKRIVANLPVEALPPHRRVCLDVACGSGTLLLASNDRIRSLFDSGQVADREAYVRQSLRGFDRDPFAVGLARLALLVHALPAGNGFSVEHRDVLADPPTGHADIVVSNPPWDHSRADGEAAQLADQFLRVMVDLCRPAGLIACVLPAGWLTDRTSRDSRNWLREHADVFETWRLPERVFRTTTWAPCVIFAQKSAASGGFAYRHVSYSDRVRFLEGDAASGTLRVEGDENLEQGFTASAIPRRSSDSTGLSLGQFALVRNGAPIDDIKSVRAKNEGRHLLLDRYGNAAPYGRIRESDTIRANYPHDFSRGPDASPDAYLTQKVLISTIRWQGSPWRMKVFLDELGVIPRNQLSALVPNDNNHETRMLLVAMFASGIVNLWVDERNATRMLNHADLKALPLPSKACWDDMIAAAEALVESATDGEPSPDALHRIEELSWKAYKLDGVERQHLEMALAGRIAPEGSVRYGAPRERTQGKTGSSVVPGAVLAVDGNSLLLQVPGATPEEGLWTDAPSRMPGWLMRPGATFLVHGIEAGLDRAAFTLHRSEWQKTEDLLSSFVGWPPGGAG